MLLFLLCSGIFVVIATILRSYYSLQSITLLPVAAGWTSRETFVAAVAVSLPGIKPLFSQNQWFRFKSSFNGTDHNVGSSNQNRSDHAHELHTIGGSGGGQQHSFGSRFNKPNEWTLSRTEHKGVKLSSDCDSEEIILEGNGVKRSKHAGPAKNTGSGN